MKELSVIVGSIILKAIWEHPIGHSLKELNITKLYFRGTLKAECPAYLKPFHRLIKPAKIPIMLCSLNITFTESLSKIPKLNHKSFFEKTFIFEICTGFFENFSYENFKSGKNKKRIQVNSTRFWSLFPNTVRKILVPRLSHWIMLLNLQN